MNTRFQRASEAADDAICRHCRRPKHEHGKMGFSCPPGKAPSVGTTFEPIEEAASA